MNNNVNQPNPMLVKTNNNLPQGAANNGNVSNGQALNNNAN